MGKQSKAQEAQAKREYLEARRREEAERQKKENQKMWRIVIAVVAAVLIIAAVAIALGASKDKTEEPVDEGSSAVTMDQLDFSAVAPMKCVDTPEVTDHVRLNVTYTDQNGIRRTGDIIIRLYAQVAPKTVANFQTLVKNGFYNGLIFHRVVEGFMIQGGGFDQDMGAKRAASIVGEMEANDFTNNLRHVRGVVSMARSNSVNSASSQFFIMQQENANLDGGYASFGYVVYGMDTVDAIAQTECQAAEGSIDEAPSQPVNPVVINSATFVIVTQ